MNESSPQPLRVFVSEYVTGGAWPEGVPTGSLAREGAAMLQGVVADLAEVPGLELHTTWDRRLGPAKWGHRATRPVCSPLTVHEANSPEQEAELFAFWSGAANAVLVIAPELDGILTQRCRQVEQRGGQLLGPTAEAVELCADKWRLAQHLQSLGIPTIPTEVCDLALSEGTTWEWPRVIKPRFGAGSTSTFLLLNPAAFCELQARRQEEPALADAVVQPWCPGTAASIAVICEGFGGQCHPLPLARQQLSTDGRFHYLGGELPLRSGLARRAQEVASAACRTIPGLRGFVGVDLLLDESTGTVTLVEINPRLTTSYLGYRQLAQAARWDDGTLLSGGATLARTLVWPTLAATSLHFSDGSTVRFQPADIESSGLSTEPLLGGGKELPGPNLPCD